MKRNEWKQMDGKKRSRDRRKKLSLLLFLMLIVICASSCKKMENNKKESVDFFAMDTYMNIQVYGEYRVEACAMAKEEIERLDNQLSTGKESSEVSRINRKGSGELSPEVENLWEKAYALFRLTDGAFDATILPMMQVWGFADGNYQVPDEDILEEALRKVNSAGVQYQEKTHTIVLADGMELDFGGIAKGYASDQIASKMREMGVEHGILNLGGNVQVIGSKTDGSDWKIGIQNPDANEDYLGVVSVRDEAVITSGGYQRYFLENDRVYHHIIDPKTGYPAENGFLSVTIVTKDGMLGDGLSTALFVMGPEKAFSYWKEHGEAFEAVFETEDQKIWITEGLQGRFSSTWEYQVVSR